MLGRAFIAFALMLAVMRPLSWAAMLATTQAAAVNAVAPTTGPALTEAQVDALIARLSSDDWQTRQQSADALAAGGPGVMPRVAAATQAVTDVDVRNSLQSVLQRIDETIRTQGTPVTLHVHDVPATDALAQLAKQVNFPITADGTDFLSGSRVTIDADNQPFWSTFSSLALQTPIRVAFGTNDPFRLAIQPMGQQMFGPKSVLCGPAIVCPITVQASRQVDLVAPGMPTNMRFFSMQLIVLVEPKLGVRQISIDTPVAVDEHGKSIGIAPNAGLRMAGLGGNAAVPGIGTNLNVHFQPPADVGKMIANFKATLRMRIPSQMLAQESPITLAQSTTAQIAGQPMTVSVVQQGDQYVFTAKTANNAVIPPAMREAALSIRLADANGTLFPRRIVQLEPDTLRAYFATSVVAFGKPPVGEPAKMIWSTAGQFRELTEPVELKDIPLME